MFWIFTLTVVPFTFRLYFNRRTYMHFGVGLVMCFILLIMESLLTSFRYIKVHNSTFLLKKNWSKIKAEVKSKGASELTRRVNCIHTFQCFSYSYVNCSEYSVLYLVYVNILHQPTVFWTKAVMLKACIMYFFAKAEI